MDTQLSEMFIFYFAK